MWHAQVWCLFGMPYHLIVQFIDRKCSNDESDETIGQENSMHDIRFIIYKHYWIRTEYVSI